MFPICPVRHNGMAVLPKRLMKKIGTLDDNFLEKMTNFTSRI
jgi:hypothetical protein